MRRIIRNVDSLDTLNENNVIQQSLYSQKETGSSCCSIAASEVTDAIKSMSDRVVTSIHDLGSKISGLDNLVSGISDKSMFSSLDNRQRFSNKEGSGIKTLAKSSNTIKENQKKEESPISVRNNLDEKDLGFMQAISYMASTSPRKPMQNNTNETSVLNKISSSLSDSSHSDMKRNDTLDKISRILNDKLNTLIDKFDTLSYSGQRSLLDNELPDFDRKGRGRGRPRPNKPSRLSRFPRGIKNFFGGSRVAAGLSAGASILGGAALFGGLNNFAIDTMAEEMSGREGKSKEEIKEELGELITNHNINDMDYGDIPMVDLTQSESEKPKSSKSLPVSSNQSPRNAVEKASSGISAALNDIKKSESAQTENKSRTENRPITTTPKIEAKSRIPSIVESGSDVVRESVNQTSLMKEQVAILRDIRRYFYDKRDKETLKQIEEETKEANSLPATSTGMNNPSVSAESPSGSPSGSPSVPMENGSLPSGGVGEPGSPDTGQTGGGGTPNASVQGYLSVMQKNAQGSTYSQPNRQGRNSYDCSSFVSRSLQEAGFDIRPDNTTSTLPSALRKIGFQYTALPIPSGTTKAPAELQAGDILLNPGSHVETYAGNNQIIGAHSSKSGVSQKSFYSTGYPGFWRLGGGGGAPASPTSTGAMTPSGNGNPTGGGGMGNPTGASGGMGLPTATGGASGGTMAPSMPSGTASPSPNGSLPSGTPTATMNPSGGTSTGNIPSPSSGSNPNFGSLLDKYETGGKGTSQITNSRGDKGGASYGKFQLSHKMGSLKEYMQLLQRENPQAYSQLAPLWGTAGQGKNGAFGQKWKELAAQGQLQKTEESYARKNYMQGGMAKLRDKGLAQRIQANPALQEVFLSTTVQHGASGGASIWNKAANSGMTDEQIIQAVYAERGRQNPNGTLAHFSGNSRDIQRGVANRFKNEVNDALALNQQFKSGKYTGQVAGGNLNTSPQGMDPNVGRFSPNTGGGTPDLSGGGEGGSGGMGGSGGGVGGGTGSEIPSFINDITLMALQTQLMYDQ